MLLGLTKLIALVPFVSEDIYKKLTGLESVHLENYPLCDESLINETIESRMDLVRELISLGRFSREETKLKLDNLLVKY